MEMEDVASWGFLATDALANDINLAIGMGIGKALADIIGSATHYGVLELGKNNKGRTRWNRQDYLSFRANVSAVLLRPDDRGMAMA